MCFTHISIRLWYYTCILKNTGWLFILYWQKKTQVFAGFVVTVPPTYVIVWSRNLHTGDVGHFPPEKPAATGSHCPASSPHLSLNWEGCLGTTDNFATISPLSSVLHCLLGLGELQACPFPDVVFGPLLLSALSSSPLHCACKMVLAECDEQETCPYHSSLCLFTMVRRSLCGPIACWILAHTSLVTWSLYEMRSILQ